MAIAWQKGYVTGYKMTFDELMKQLSRWYDFEYEGAYDSVGLYTFSIHRNTKLSTFLRAIEVASEHITFHIENTGVKGGRKVYVTKGAQ